MIHLMWNFASNVKTKFLASSLCRTAIRKRVEYIFSLQRKKTVTKYVKCSDLQDEHIVQKLVHVKNSV